MFSGGEKFSGFHPPAAFTVGVIHVLTLSKGSRKLNRRLETPSKTQAEVLSCFEYYVDDSGVLQIIKR
jgi:hypothetical protein